MASPTSDISQLSESQQTALETYTSVTNQDPLEAIALLQRSQWNVQIGITRFFEGEPTSDPFAEAQAAHPPISTRRVANLQQDDLFASSRSASPASRSPNSVGRVSTEPTSQTRLNTPWVLQILFAPFSTVYRLLFLALSPIGRLFPFIPRLLARFTPTQHPRPTRRSLAPADNARRFIREFSEEYGPTTLPFVECGFNLALDNAKKDCKFLMVVLISPSHDDTNAWIRETLCTPQIQTFLSNHSRDLVLWGGNVQDAEAYQVADVVQCAKYPFAALLCQTPDSDSTGLSTVMRATGRMPTSKLLSKLESTIQANQPHLDTVRLQRQEANASRSLRQEQDSAYERSLAQDRERARKKREETEAQARLEKEALAKEEELQRSADRLQQWRRWRAQSLPEEPERGAKDAIRLSIRLSTGEKVIRAFGAQTEIEEVYAFIECYDVIKDGLIVSEKEIPEPEDFEHTYRFRLVSPMPRTVYEPQEGVLVSDKVGRGANLIVEPIDEDDGAALD